MPIDYSKWDKIELSDDSDIEVHPNVDKRSFIRWKQRDIHEKRHQRNIEIKSILIQLTMYAKLNKRVDYLLDNLSSNDLLDQSKVLEILNKSFDPKEKFDYEKLKEEKGSDLRKGLKDLEFSKEEIESTPPYNEMIEDLFVQIKEDHPEAASDGEKLLGYIKEHRAKIDDVLSKQTIKLDELLYQKSLLISSDDYHTGFDRSFLNKDKEEDDEPPQPKKTVTTVETINSPQKADTPSSQPKTDEEAFDELQVLPQTAEFAKIPYKELEKSAQFLIAHPSICTEHQKDSLIMTAFDHQLEGDTNGAKQIIYQSLLLQYISQLAGPHASKDQTIRAVKLFFTKLKDSSLPASKAFEADVENTVNHIKTRCEVIRKEQLENAGEDEQLIQLKSLDDSSELIVNPPEEGSEEYKIFTSSLSPEMQAAVRSGSLDEVNKVFATMKIADAEQTLEIFNQCGVIGVSGILENEQEFEQLKEEYEERQNLPEHGVTRETAQEHQHDLTPDVVD
ncbi:putative hsp90 co-chaperone protein [Clavispora lusitaniae]|uniref:Hsp90 co-chaperone protein n=1 Tax=Clavispora lusitaniae TaxID=36911 RepID=A0ACD0WNB4_CLALS|nr:putative hsp90 co-chaperone protein [Clavispora lusitaniae]QFZ34549.1 putative hsp90 co-chaperone protein [Clavispora lusitaniae]QFZ40234.1 putative hsp90 co-chaperone protein [Clavispora lusitaniae]QFZ45914.1 putative hsp90 co-chaperone protein [Clavispora lusitaniae]QFZ51576.1 putative hsp90 co-chaperone protein [Clavispora lusitaniae]